MIIWFFICSILCSMFEKGEKIVGVPNYSLWIMFARTLNIPKSSYILKYLKDPEANLNNVLIMTENLNIRDNDWDPLYPHHSTPTDILREIANSFNLELSVVIKKMPTYYTDNFQDSNSVIDLMFLHTNSEELNYNLFLLTSENLHTMLLCSFTL